MKSIDEIDKKFMSIAIELAKKGIYNAHPNPIVGAVIVKDGKILGKGYHKEFGKAHAEINAIKDAKICKGADLYVTLEPCSTTGKTPPCTQAIIKAGIKRVIIGTNDPNPLNHNRAKKILEAANIQVKTGVLEKECQKLNPAFNKYIKTKIPYVTLKISQSLDGKIADFDGNSKWISSKKARIEAHKLRAQADAICAGINTIIRDNPLLNVRYVKVKKQPTIIVLDSNGKTPKDSNIFKNEKVLIATTKNGYESLLPKIKDYKNVETLILPSDENNQIEIKSLLIELGKKGISHLMVEGGGKVISSFLSKGLWDRFICFISPLIIGGEKSKSAVVWSDLINKKNKRLGMKVKINKITKIGRDLMFEIFPDKN